MKPCEEQALKWETAVGTFPQVDPPALCLRLAGPSLSFLHLLEKEKKKIIFGPVPPKTCHQEKVKKGRVPKTEEERDTDKCAFEENISRLRGAQAELSLLSKAGHISVDESWRPFEVVAPALSPHPASSN